MLCLLGAALAMDGEYSWNGPNGKESPDPATDNGERVDRDIERILITNINEASSQRHLNFKTHSLLLHK